MREPEAVRGRSPFTARPLLNALQVFKNSQVKMVVVPHFGELAAKQIQELVEGNPLFTPYLPDLAYMTKPLNRQYLYNVSASPRRPLTSYRS